MEIITVYVCRDCEHYVESNIEMEDFEMIQFEFDIFSDAVEHVVKTKHQVELVIAAQSSVSESE